MKKTKILFLVLLIVCLSAGMVYGATYSTPATFNMYVTNSSSSGNYYMAYNNTSTLTTVEPSVSYWTVTVSNPVQEVAHYGHTDFQSDGNHSNPENETTTYTGYWNYTEDTTSFVIKNGDSHILNADLYIPVYLVNGTLDDNGGNDVTATGGTIYGSGTHLQASGTVYASGTFESLAGSVTMNGDTSIQTTDTINGSSSNATVKGGGNTQTLTVVSGEVLLTDTVGTVNVSGGTVTANNTSTIYDINVIGGTLNISAGNLLTNDINSYGIVSGTGTLYVANGTVTLPITNSGTYEIAGGNVSGNITNTGVLKVKGGILSLAATNDGTMIVSGGLVSGTIDNSSNAVITVDGGLISSSIENYGDIYIEGSSSDGNITGVITGYAGEGVYAYLYIQDGKFAKVNGHFANLAGDVTISGGNLEIDGTDNGDLTYVSDSVATVTCNNNAYGLTVGGTDAVVLARGSYHFLSNQGNLTINGTTTVADDIYNSKTMNIDAATTVGGLITNTSTGTLDVNAALTANTITNAGIINIDAASSAAGVVTNSGTINVNKAFTASAGIASSGIIYVNTGGTIIGTVEGTNTTSKLYVVDTTSVNVIGVFDNIAGIVNMTGSSLTINRTTDAGITDDGTYGFDKAIVYGNSVLVLTVNGGDVTLRNLALYANVHGGKLTDEGKNTVYGFYGTVVGNSASTYTTLYVDNEGVEADEPDNSSVLAYGNFASITVYINNQLEISGITTVAGIVSNAGIINANAVTSVTGVITNSGTINVNAALTASADITNSGTIYVKTGGTIAGTVISTTGNLYVRTGTSVDVRGTFSNISGNVVMTGGALTINGTADSNSTYGSSKAIVAGAAFDLTVTGVNSDVTLNGTVSSAAITGGTLTDNGGNIVNSNATSPGAVHVHGIGTTLDATGAAITYAQGTFALVTGTISSCDDITITTAGITAGGISTSAAITGLQVHDYHMHDTGLGITVGYNLILVNGYADINGFFNTITNSAIMDVIGATTATAISNNNGFTITNTLAVTGGALVNTGTGEVDVIGTLVGNITNTSTSNHPAVCVDGGLYGTLTTNAGTLEVYGNTETSLIVNGGTAYIGGTFHNVVGSATMSDSLHYVSLESGYDAVTIEGTSDGKATITGATTVNADDFSAQYYNPHYPVLEILGGTVDIVGGNISYLYVDGGSVAITGGTFTSGSSIHLGSSEVKDLISNQGVVHVTSPGTLAVSGGLFYDESMVPYIIAGYTYSANTTYDTTTPHTYYQVSRIVYSGGGGSYVAPKPVVQPTLRFNIGNINSYQTTGSAIETLHVMDVAPVLFEDRTLLPIRFVVEPLAGTITWNEAEQKVTIVRGTTTIELWIGNNMAKINGVATMIDPENPNVKPIIVEPGRTMLPLRFISEALGCTVTWDEAKQEIVIKY